MRWLVFFLIVLNVLFFTWFHFQQEQQQLQVRVQQPGFNFKRVPGLTLLSEITPEQLQQMDLRNAEVGMAEPVPVAQMCAVVGPYPEVVSARQIKSRLDGEDIESTIVIIDKPLPSINWVYMKPRATRKEALSVLKRLQSDHIDSFLVAEGENQNAISLGFFNKIESAQAMVKELKAKGYDANMMEKERIKETFWLAVQPAFVEKINESLMLDLQKDFPETKKQEKSCEDVALLKIIE